MRVLDCKGAQENILKRLRALKMESGEISLFEKYHLLRIPEIANTQSADVRSVGKILPENSTE